MNDLERVLRLLFVLDEREVHSALAYSYCYFGDYTVLYDDRDADGAFFFYCGSRGFQTDSIWYLSEKIIQQVDIRRREELL